MATFTMRLDPQSMKDLHANFGKLLMTMQKAGSLSAWNQAQKLFSRSRAVVPYLDGLLYNAAYVVKLDGSDDVPTWAVGYDTFSVPYAWDQHETAGRNHPTRGPSNEAKQDHYLSEPRDAMVATFPSEVARDLREALGGIHFVVRSRR